jgi:hypothetical protein
MHDEESKSISGVLHRLTRDAVEAIAAEESLTLREWCSSRKASGKEEGVDNDC